MGLCAGIFKKRPLYLYLLKYFDKTFLSKSTYFIFTVYPIKVEGCQSYHCPIYS